MPNSCVGVSLMVAMALHAKAVLAYRTVAKALCAKAVWTYWTVDKAVSCQSCVEVLKGS